MEHATGINKNIVAKPEQSLTLSVMSEMDIPSYCAMFQHVFAEPPWNETWAIDEISKSIKKAMCKKGFIGFTAKWESLPVGHTTGYRLPLAPTLFYLDQLFIDNAYQGHGIGKALFSKIRQTVKSHGYRGIILLTKVDSFADRFYALNGFIRLFPIIRIKGKILQYLSLL